MLNEKIAETNRGVLNITDILIQLKKYNILSTFASKEELDQWLLELNSLERHNILCLDIDPNSIKFDSKLLIDKNLLNTLDYKKRVESLVSIKNAEGYYHLFDNILKPEFLNSDKFYQDIETLKRAKCAQTSLWIIGESTFINSPYHDEDFELLVTSRDVSDKHFDYVVWDAIATVAKNYDSIYSDSGYHRQDLQTIVKYGAQSLQLSHTYPEGSINNLAINPVSLKDNYHLENMEILAQNPEIGNFLYAVMTHPSAIKRRDYRNIISEMVENKDNISYVSLVCYYALGEEEVVRAQNLDEGINVLNVESKDTTIYEIECNNYGCSNQDEGNKKKNFIRRFF